MILINNHRIVNLIIKCILVIFIVMIALPITVYNYLAELRFRRNATALCIFCLSLFSGHHISAQGFKRFVRDHHAGFECSFGINSSHLTSNIQEIDNLIVKGEGGSIGLVWGAKSVVVKLRQGFYYSASSVPHTVDQFRSSVSVNFYPLYFLNPYLGFRPYMLMAIGRNTFQMHGFYGTNDRNSKNYSLSEDPYLGKIEVLQASVGGGVEHFIKTPINYVGIFTEVRYGQSIVARSSNQLFSQTKPSDQVSMNVGIRFGYYR